MTHEELIQDREVWKTAYYDICKTSKTREEELTRYQKLEAEWKIERGAYQSRIRELERLV